MLQKFNSIKEGINPYLKKNVLIHIFKKVADVFKMKFELPLLKVCWLNQDLPHLENQGINR